MALKQIGVMGAGAVGCYYGAMLGRTGHQVTLIGRPQHVDEMRRSGLRLQTNAFDEYIRVQASTDPPSPRPMSRTWLSSTPSDRPTTANGAAWMR